MNWFKRKNNTIKIVPAVEGIVDNVPIVPAKNFLPKWWENIGVNDHTEFFGNTPFTTGSVRRCPGFIDLLQTGWIMPAWCDIAVEIKGKDGISWKLSNNNFKASLHPQSHFIDHLPKHMQEKYSFCLKLESPWYFITPPGYSTLYLEPPYHYNEYFDVASGIQDSDWYPNTHTFLLFKKEGQFIIEKGTPLLTLIPFKRDNLKIEFEEFDEKRISKIKANEAYVFSSKFSSMLTYKKEQYKRKKCPFHKES